MIQTTVLSFRPHRFYVPVSIGLMLVAFLSSLVGCVDCEKRFCRGVRVSSVQLMSVADRCCLEPSRPGCEDPEGFFQRALEKMMLAYDACHENNYERMKQILDELLGLLPFFSLESICDDRKSLDESLRDWLDGHCELMRNAGPIFGPEDTISLSVLLPLGGAKARTGGMFRTHDESPDDGRTFHAFEPDASISFDAWFASGNPSLDGGIVLGSERALPGGGRIIPVHGAVFELGPIGQQPRCRILATDLQRSDRRVCGWIVLDALGEGRLGVQVCFDDLQGEVHGPSWFECPVELRQGMLRLGSPRPQMALDLFPVDESIHELFDIVDDADRTISSDDAPDFDPCERVNGASRRALAWLQRLRMVFPDCFSESGSSR